MMAGTNAGNSVTTGLRNVCVGFNAGTQITSGDDNVFVGHETGKLITTGNGCTSVGSRAGKNGVGSDNTCIGVDTDTGLTSGNGNTCLGHNANCTDNVSNSTALGNNSRCDANNQCTIGNPGVNQVRPSSNALCDLGTAANRWKDVHVGGDVIATGDIVAEALTDLKMRNQPGNSFIETKASGDTFVTGQQVVLTSATPVMIAGGRAGPGMGTQLELLNYDNTAKVIVKDGGDVSIIAADTTMSGTFTVDNIRQDTDSDAYAYIFGADASTQPSVTTVTVPNGALGAFDHYIFGNSGADVIYTPHESNILIETSGTYKAHLFIFIAGLYNIGFKASVKTADDNAVYTVCVRKTPPGLGQNPVPQICSNIYFQKLRNRLCTVSGSCMIALAAGDRLSLTAQTDVEQDMDVWGWNLTAVRMRENNTIV